MPLWNGDYWKCVCGFYNGTIRTRCRNVDCSKLRIDGDVGGTPEQVDAERAAEMELNKYSPPAIELHRQKGEPPC